VYYRIHSPDVEIDFVMFARLEYSLGGRNGLRERQASRTEGPAAPLLKLPSPR
jgi:hypothetical protein